MRESNMEISEADAEQILMHGEIMVHGCYDNALKLSVKLPEVLFEGSLFEMIDLLPISPRISSSQRRTALEF
ncbi:hypothetical protein PRIPAC_75091 [Pristionchus pacificus]|uniref:Uncharacterized protein n=1 Tax=Pristionchus pacificus TaxID=54126 RepID=A0A454XVH7_PRIPA|nr:hypothetical protein PRIPAC_75091 [Pristionchus pacificus]|eukprot:PDM71940.1 hypothetical protein PRIPAC_38347 [Pristionchus pacificus]